MSKDNNWTTIQEAQLIERLAQFRAEVEAEAEEPITAIETNLALALADVTEGLGLTDPEFLRHILGPAAYLAVYVDPVPYRPADPPLHKVRLLLAQLRDTWRGRWADAFPVPPPT